jgi:hypothetical protein
MTGPEYQELMRKAASYMRRVNCDAWAKWSLEKLPRFDWNQEQGRITFTGPNQPPVVADIQFVGSWSEKAGTWMWAWANESVLESMKKEVQEVLEFGRLNQLIELIDPVWKAPLEAAWDMTTLSCYILQSDMAYRAPDSQSPGFTFLSLRNLQHL